ncbi:hypothetical protein EJ065_7035 [Corallococcus coralloides]|uniref:Uncharacterized protein n=1 Tax=Corallococcus coralloides TaxID=184914 RepID=A0A410S335_CORCK|nr:hypothetical protein EJ065_7035 [Corallococcus coralloides]
MKDKAGRKSPDFDLPGDYALPFIRHRVTVLVGNEDCIRCDDSFVIVCKQTT